jgi:hypothetical protein
MDGCYKRFGSKHDWKRHETTRALHPEQGECYRCNGDHTSEDGRQCFKAFYSGREQYIAHLTQLVTPNRIQVEIKANENRIPANNQYRYWCGFCNRIIEHGKTELEAATERLEHIAHHLLTKSSADWVELGGNGEKKGDAEERKKREKKRLRAQQHEEESNPDCSSSSAPDSQELLDENMDQENMGYQGLASTGQPLQIQRPNAYYQNAQMDGTGQMNIPRPHPDSRARQIQRVMAQSREMQQAIDSQEPSTSHFEDRGTILSTQVTCCNCAQEWSLDFANACVMCDHPICHACTTI